MPSRCAGSPAKEISAFHGCNLPKAQSPSRNRSEKRQSLEGADGVSSERGWSEVVHMSNSKSTLSRSLSDPVRKAGPPGSFHRHYISYTTLDTVSSKKSPDSLVDTRSGDRVVYHFEPSKNTEHMILCYGACKHANGLAADQQATVWERRTDGEKLLSEFKLSNKIDTAVRAHLEGFSEDNANTSLSAPQVSSSSSSSVVGLEDGNISRSGWTTDSTESVKMRKHKSPVQMERARERQRLARRAKRAAKALHRRENFTVLDINGISEDTEQIVQDGESQAEDLSPSASLKSEIEEFQWSFRFGKLALGGSHEGELERVKQLFEKQTEKDLRIINRFLEEWFTQAQAPVRFFFGSI